MDQVTSKTQFTHKLIRNVIILVSISILLLLIIIGVSFSIINNNHQYVEFSAPELLERLPDNGPVTAIVLGSGLTRSGEPRSVLQQRLDATKELYESGIVDDIIVSGYNPDETYNEPQAMEDYLTVLGVSEDKIQQDKSGDNTHATCRRAKNEFQVDRAVVVTQPGHIDRTIYLCRSKDIETYGYPAEIIGTTRYQASQSIREAFANIKAVAEVTFSKE